MSLAPARVGYCTNVHPGTDLATIRQTLQQHAVPIAQRRRQLRSDGGPLPVGLWIPASAAEELATGESAEQMARWLADHQLTPLSINGFPYDNFHLPVVKHRVYRPAWWHESRLQYTIRLAEILQLMMPCEETIGSISTLPLGWPGALGRSDGDAGDDDRNIAVAAENLRRLATALEQLEQRRGRRIVVAIEPEPGCLIDRYHDLVRFFDRELPEATHRRYLGVCHDVCHSAVMFESQAQALAAYARAGIVVGKVQISSAIELARPDQARRRQAAIDELSRFAEDRYLHQTGALDAAGRFRLVEDLPQWLAEQPRRQDEQLRVHFHVPVYRQRFGPIETTQAEIGNCLAALGGDDAPRFTGHYEIETYAWSVLPESLREPSLAEAIGTELDWFEQQLAGAGLS